MCYSDAVHVLETQRLRFSERLKTVINPNHNRTLLPHNRRFRRFDECTLDGLLEVLSLRVCICV